MLKTKQRILDLAKQHRELAHGLEALADHLPDDISSRDDERMLSLFLSWRQRQLDDFDR